MRWSAELEDDVWVFTDERGNVVFRSDTMDEATAHAIVESIAAHDSLCDLARRLVDAADRYKTYDYALSPENVLAMAAEASQILNLLAPNVDRNVKIVPLGKNSLG